jgi:hypothetical protein
MDLSHLDKLLGFTKPIEEHNEDELNKVLIKHFPHTRPTGTSLADLAKDPLFAGVDIEKLMAAKTTFKMGSPKKT